MAELPTAPIVEGLDVVEDGKACSVVRSEAAA